MVAPALGTTHFVVKIDGAKLADKYQEAVAEIIVDHNLHLPAMASVTFSLHDADWSSDPLLAEAKTLKLEAMQHTTPVVVFEGKVASVELEHDVAVLPLLTLRAYDNSFALHRHRHRRSFLNKTDSDIASQLASEAGLSPSVDSTGAPFEFLFQYNQSDYEFLRERARRIGFDLWVDGTQLYFKKPQPGSAAATVTWGTTLKRLQVRTSLADVAKQVTVRGWDPKAKQAIVGQASSAVGLPQIQNSSSGPSLAQRAWNVDSEFVVTDEWVASEADARQVAQSYLDELGDSFVEVEGQCEGLPNLRPRMAVTVDGAGTRFNGTYQLSAVRHTWNTTHGQETVFVGRSRRSGTESELLDGSRPRKLTTGPVIAIVTNLQDPDQKGRIKVKYPWLTEDHESHWARIAAPLSGGKRGQHFLPEVDDEVLVDFLQGDFTQPYIIGGLWNGKDEPPVPPSLPGGRDDQILQGGKVKNRLIKSTKGNMLILCDQDGAPGIFLVGSSGAYIMVDDEQGKEKIVIADKSRNNRIEVRSSGEQNEIIIKNLGDVVLTTDGNLKATVTKDVEVKATGNVKVEATGNVDVNATGNATVKATGNATVEATGNLQVKGMAVTVEATAVLTLKGATVSIQGSGPVAIQGTPVAIN